MCKLIDVSVDYAAKPQSKNSNEKDVSPVANMTKPPKSFSVVLLDDNATPMDFVVNVLQKFFAMDELRALKTMLKVHCQGQGVCGLYSRDVAETKVWTVRQFIQQFHYPLMCKVEINR